ncbi:MAG: hypothetical protein U9Q82_03435 [Chloroflexota bacterium]|nr:hypothetical protein [Chloroflexota bacterium]
MRKKHLNIRRLFVNILLFGGLIALLAIYIGIVSNLPARLYTAAQKDFLSYNTARSIVQTAPTMNTKMAAAEVESEGVIEPAMLPALHTKVDAALSARYEEQSGVSVTVFDLDYQSEYLLTYPGPAESAPIELFFPFPSNLETLHEVQFLVDGQEPPGAQYSVQGISWQSDLATEREHTIAISYQADGVNSFAYGLQQNRRSDVDVTLTVLGLRGSEVPRHSLPTTDVSEIEDSEIFTWQYNGLIPNRDIQLNLPTRLSFRQRVAQLQDDFRTLGNWAPILIGFFLASLAILLRFADIHLPLESYLMMGFALAIFYPTLTFLSGLVNVVMAAIFSFALISSLLVVFLGLTVGWRQTWWRAALLLFIFLGIFSLGMLSPWRKLLATGGVLLLTATIMLAYARRVSPPEPEAPAPSLKPKSTSELELDLDPEIVSPPEDAAARQPIRAHCPQCGHPLAEDYAFCPGCSYDTSDLHRCENCGLVQTISPEAEKSYCLHCGELLG